MPLSSKILLIISALFGILSITIWFVFLRPVPVYTSEGEIVSKEYKPESTYYQYPVGHPRGFRTPNAIPIAESYGFEIRLSGSNEHVRTALNVVAGGEFKVGDRVSVDYVRRGFLWWDRVYVLGMNKVQ